jgi:polar amino acid transport system permease protein
MYAWDWQIILQHWLVFFYGLGVTVWLSALTIVLGTALGGGLALVERSRISMLRLSARFYIKIFRAVPLLVLLYWVYYVAPSLIEGIKMSAFVTAVVALVLNLASFAAENIRAGLKTVTDQNQYQFSLLDCNELQSIWYIVIPQAIPNMLPNLMNQWITSIKLTSLASVIGVNELFARGGVVINATQRPLEVYTILAVMYLIIIIPLDLWANAYENQLANKGKDLDKNSGRVDIANVKSDQ